MRRKEGYSLHPLARPKGAFSSMAWIRTRRYTTRAGLEALEVQYVDRKTQEILLEFSLVHHHDYTRVDCDGHLLPLQWRIMKNGDILDQPKLKR